MAQMTKTLAGITLALLLAGSAAHAAGNDQKSLGTFGNWSAYTYAGTGGKVCYMASQPQKEDSNPAGAKRGDVFVYITDRPGDQSKDVVSLSIGYPFKKGSTPVADVDGKKFDFFVKGDKAWTKDDGSDAALSTAIRKGSKLIISGTSVRGTETTDTYDLKGSGDASKAIAKACGG